MYTIKQVCEMTGLSEVYVRRMIQHGKLQTEKVPMPNMKNTFQHMISEDELNRWRSASANHRREDGRSRFILYATAEEKAELDQLIAENENGAIITRQNKVKQSE